MSCGRTLTRPQNFALSVMTLFETVRFDRGSLLDYPFVSVTD